MRIDSSGNVLIGTTSNTGKLAVALTGGHVFNTELNSTTLGSSNGALISNYYNSTTRLSAINFAADSVSAGSLIFGTASSSTLTEKMRITSGGNVGIGTSNPLAKLNVVDNSNNCNLYIGYTGGGGTNYFQSNGGQFFTNSAGSAQYAMVNPYGIGVGTAVPSSGFGVAFPATQSASSDANTLDDYEEGTWTPTINPTSGTVTIATNGMRYTKIGNMVSISGFLSISSVSSPSGLTTMGGFPFVPFSYPGNGSNVSYTMYGTNGNLPANGVFWAYTYSGGNGAFLRITSGNGITELGNFFQAGTEFWINATYQAA
jgi:hypothetical protein